MIQLDRQEKYVWIATNEGWYRNVGFIVNINGIEFSIIPHSESSKVSLVFSELESGARLVEVPVDIIKYLEAATKGKAMTMFYEESKRVQRAIEHQGIENIKEKSKQAKDKMVSRFGERPDIEDYFVNL